MVSIIIVNYNTFQYVLDCIESIKSKTKGLDYEIIVVDNFSPNREIENLNLIEPEVKLILNDENSGFGSACNLGVKNAIGNKLFFLNSDTLLQNNAIKILSDYLDNNSDAAVCGGNLYVLDLKPATSFSRLKPGIIADLDYFFFNGITNFFFNRNIYFNHSNQILEIKGTISGANYMIKKSNFDFVGGFDEDFFMYYEETELSYRVINSGYKIINNPSAKIIHFEGGSEEIKERSLNWSFESKKKYFLKTSNLTNYYISNAIFFFTILQRLLIFTILNNKPKIQYWLSIFSWSIKKF